jgi:ankyrin repeat protein
MDDKTNKLMKAVQNSDVKAVERLIKEGANAAYEDYQQGSWGEYSRISIIHHALRAEKFNLEIVKLLLEAGASVNSKWEDKSWTGSHDQVMILN